MEETSNFIKTIMAEDLESGRVKEIITRFPQMLNYISDMLGLSLQTLRQPQPLEEKQIFVLMILIQQRKNKNSLMRLLKT